MARKPKKLNETKEVVIDEVIRITRELAEADFVYFIRLIFPKQVIGHIHEDLCKWMSREDAKDHQLILMPRDHGKSRFAAFFAIWQLTRDPAKRILYISNTTTLAEKQLGFIKDIMDGSLYRLYWPEMINPKEGERKRWTNTEIAVDHPKRAAEGIRDPSIMVAGLTTSIVGLHFDLAILDDVVTGDNAYTEEGRTKVARQFSFLASIEGAEAREVVVGTRYHPKDLYNEMLNMFVDIFDDDGTVVEKEPVYELFERQVEDRGDMTGQYLWPRTQRSDGQWFGFDRKILATKFAKYVDKSQFYAQYYNNPNNTDDADIKREHFQYFEPAKLKMVNGNWHYAGKRLNIIASVDLAYTLETRSDYTTIAIVGIDSDRHYYILDIDRYKTRQIRDQFQHILDMHRKWDFKKLVVEGGPAGPTIVESLRNDHFRPNGLMVTCEVAKVPRNEGTKVEQMSATLNPVYQNMSVWHNRGGDWQTLEEELILRFPPHDDIKDAVHHAIKNLSAPSANFGHNYLEDSVIDITSHPRFGGLGGSVRVGGLRG